MSQINTNSGGFLVIAALVLLVFGVVCFYVAPSVATSSTITVFEPPIGDLNLDIQVAMAEGASVSHANARHGTEADLARTCSDQSSNPIRFFNPSTKRSAWVCDLGGYFGIHIFEETGEEVTAFVKNKMKRVEQVLKYMENAGYTLLH